MKFCRIVTGVFGVLWLLALALLLIGIFGLFGQEQDPLSAVFLIPLGLPWNRLFDLGDTAGLWLLALAPLINLAILTAICRFVGARRNSRT